MAKQVAFKQRQLKDKPNAQNLDKWVNNATTKSETVRYTIDLPEQLHRHIKIQCASKGVKMNREVLTALNKYFETEM